MTRNVADAVSSETTGDLVFTKVVSGFQDTASTIRA